MLLRLSRKWIVMLAALAVLTGLVLMSSPAQAADPVTLKVGTLAPAASPWGAVFKIWQKGINDRTNGAIQIQFFWSGQQGDESAMVGKIRTGQLDGAAISAVGLGEIYKQVLVLQIPGTFSSWAKLDAARNKMKGHFDAKFAEAGFKNLGWGDVGAARLMTKGFEVRTPAQMKHKNCYTIKGDPVSPMLYGLIGEINPKTVSVPEITTGLTAGTINVVNAPALVAEQLQWAPQLDHINTMVSGYGIGALVFSMNKFNGLPEDAKKALEETGALAGAALTNSIRRADDEAYTRLAVGYPAKTPPIPARMTAYTPTEAEKAEWVKLFAATKAKLKGGTFEAGVMDQVDAAAK
jgi:TRAP-type transport system periplasmic protein